MATQRNVVRPGDVFNYAGTGRAATVMFVRPGGVAELRIEGLRNGKPSLMLGDAQVRSVKLWSRLGRAEYLDGSYLSAKHLAATGGAA